MIAFRKCARRWTIAATMPARRAALLAPQAAAGSDWREQRAAHARPRRFRLHQSVEFSAGNFHRRRSPVRSPQAIALWRSPPNRHRSSPSRRSSFCIPPVYRPGSLTSGAGRRQNRRDAHCGSPRRGRCLHGLDRSCPRASTAHSRPRDGPIPPLIAETGGVNAMIVDATALPEQVTDDVITSAFRSAGQRCSALRLLCVQEDVADRVFDMVAGAARELRLGDPRDPATHVGPVIDGEARNKLDRWIADDGLARCRTLPAGGRILPEGRHLCCPGDHRARQRARAQGRSLRSGAACRPLARRRARSAAR